MIKNRLQEILTRDGVEKTELAKKAGISMATIAKVADRRGSVPRATKIRIIRALNALTGRKYSIYDVFPPLRIEITVSKSSEEFTDEDERSLLESIRNTVKQGDVELKHKISG